MEVIVASILLLLFAVNLDAVTHSNILFLSPVPSPSHYIFNKALAEALALRGHNITFVSGDTSNKVIQNFHYIHLERIYSHYQDVFGRTDYLEVSRRSCFQNLLASHKYSRNICEGIRLSRGTKVIKRYPKNFKFDLVISDYVYGPCFLGLMPKFSFPPLIGISAVNNPSFTVDILAGDKLSMEQLSYTQRLYNEFLKFFDSLYRKYSTTPAIEKQMRDIFGIEGAHADELEKGMSIMLVNSHPVIDYTGPLPQNVIQVGGLQINEPNTVSRDLHDFLMGGHRGAILMSLGTNMRIDELGQDVILEIIETFRQLPDYNFLWKFETHKVIKDLPKNVMVRHWMTRNDVLAHPQIKAFITHGGTLPTHKAIWHGMPMIVVPFTADQKRNSINSVQNGIATKVDFHSFTTEKFKRAIVEVLHNPKYKRNILQKSKLYKDQPEKPLERAVWWCEFIMRHPQVDHLKPASHEPNEFLNMLLKLILGIILAFWICCKIWNYFKPKEEVVVLEVAPKRIEIGRQKIRKFE